MLPADQGKHEAAFHQSLHYLLYLMVEYVLIIYQNLKCKHTCMVYLTGGNIGGMHRK